MPCRHPDCQDAFRFRLSRKHHEAKEHDLHLPDDSPVSNENARDDLFSYSKAHISLGLLLMNANDAVKEGDGERLQRVLGVLTFVFKAMGNTKYAYACLRLTACRLSLLSPKMYHQLIHNRFCNTTGQRGKCISRDLRLEHLNGVLKPMIKALGYQNITDKLVVETSQALHSMESIIKNVKSDIGQKPRSGVHCNKHGLALYDYIFEEVHNKSKNMQFTPGRELVAFKGIKANIFDNLRPDELYTWIQKLRRKWHRDNRHFYKFE